MNCRQARSLFSARIDGELLPAESRLLEVHLRECQAGCAERWTEFETTVRMVRALPAVEPDPSFVGQVLDRVRAWEAAEAGRTPQTARGSSRLRRRHAGLRGADWRGRLRDWADAVAGSRPWAPVRLAGAVALGVGGGLVIGAQLWAPNGLSPGASVADRSMTSAPTVPGSQIGGTDAASARTRPFGDLAGDLASVRGTDNSADSLHSQPEETGNESVVYPGGTAGLQVRATPGEARPRVTITDGRPQITF